MLLHVKNRWNINEKRKLWNYAGRPLLRYVKAEFVP